MKWIKKFEYAFAGLIYGLKQPSVILQIILASVAITVFWIIKISWVEWMIVMIMIAFVILSEWLNSIVEMTIDYISLDIHPQAKTIKDLSAGLVFLSGLFAFIVGVMILINSLF